MPWSVSDNAQCNYLYRQQSLSVMPPFQFLSHCTAAVPCTSHERTTRIRRGTAWPPQRVGYLWSSCFIQQYIFTCTATKAARVAMAQFVVPRLGYSGSVYCCAISRVEIDKKWSVRKNVLDRARLVAKLVPLNDQSELDYGMLFGNRWMFRRNVDNDAVAPNEIT